MEVMEWPFRGNDLGLTKKSRAFLIRNKIFSLNSDLNLNLKNQWRYWIFILLIQNKFNSIAIPKIEIADEKIPMATDWRDLHRSPLWELIQKWELMRWGKMRIRTIADSSDGSRTRVYSASSSVDLHDWRNRLFPFPIPHAPWLKMYNDTGANCYKWFSPEILSGASSGSARFWEAFHERIRSSGCLELTLVDRVSCAAYFPPGR